MVKKQKEGKTSIKKLAAVAAVVGVSCLALGGIGGALIADDSSELSHKQTTINYLNNKVAELENAEPVVVTETITETVEIPVIEEVEVLVDNGNLDLVLDTMYNDDGLVDYLIEDLDDDEMAMVVDRIVLVNDAKTLALNELEAEAFDELDLVTFGLVQFDEDELYRLDADFEDIVVVDTDFDNDAVELMVPFTFKQDGVKYAAELEVTIEDNDVEDFDIVNIQLA